MHNKEVRMRCIEALSSMGVRAAKELVTHAQVLEAWVLAVPDEPTEEKAMPPQAAPKVPPKSADKG